MEYLDFEVTIDSTGGADYRVSVLDSPAGQTSETVRFPFDQRQLKDRLDSLREALVHARGTRDVVPETQDAQSGRQAARDFGTALFELLFAGDVRNLFIQSLRQAEEKPDRGLRVRFRTQAPELAVLPWELLYDRRPGSFVCLSNATPFVRFLPTQQPAGTLAVTPPLRVLGMIASPRGLPALDVSREKALMETALAEAKRRIELEWLPAGSWRVLSDALGPGRGPWHIFHFIGHGGFDPGRDGYLVLTTEQGDRYDLSAASLADLLTEHKPLRLVVLNACRGAQGTDGDLFSSTASTLVRRGIPAVVSMQQEISDQAALEFSREFYGALGRGSPVDAAVAQARRGISLARPESIEWSTPMIHMRSPDGVLFRVDRPRPLWRSAWERLAKWEKRLPSPARVVAGLSLVFVAVLAVVVPRLGRPPAQRVAARLAFLRDTATLLPGDTYVLQPWGFDSGGQRIAPIYNLQWSSSNPAVATVKSQGQLGEVEARALGFAVIGAMTADGERATANIRVVAPVAYVEVHPAEVSLASEATVQLDATLRTADGGILRGRALNWKSGDTTVATVSESGLVTAHASGRTTVTTTSEGRQGAATIRVRDGSDYTLHKVSGEGSTIQLLKYGDFVVRVVDSAGRPVVGAKVAWRTPAGGPKTWVGATGSDGRSKASNLYTFPNAGTYTQTATLVAGNSVLGFTTAPLTELRPPVTFSYHQN